MGSLKEDKDHLLGVMPRPLVDCIVNTFGVVSDWHGPAHLVEGVMRHSAPQEDESEREGGHVEHRHDHLAACQSDGGSKGGARFQTGGGVCRCEPE